jgi:hypothetical protein
MVASLWVESVARQMSLNGLKAYEEGRIDPGIKVRQLLLTSTPPLHLTSPNAYFLMQSWREWTGVP